MSHDTGPDARPARSRFRSDLRDLLSLYRAEFQPTIGEWWQHISSLSTTLGIILGAILYFTKPRDETAMLNLVWQLPLIIFVCFVVITLFLIPYRELQKYRDKANETEGELRDEIKRLGTEHKRKLDEVANQLNTHFYRKVLPEETNKLKAQLTELMTKRNALKSQLHEERTEPYIKGEIKEVHIESWFPKDYAKQRSIVWFITAYVHIVNVRAMTTIKDYRLVLSVGGQDYEGHPVSLASYFITRKVERPVHLEVYIDEVQEDLADLRQFNLTPVERNIGREGWLRFKVSGIPIFEDDAPQRSDEMTLVLYIIDATDNSHSIHASSPWIQTGEIRRQRY
jgi:hypothetical protein